MLQCWSLFCEYHLFAVNREEMFMSQFVEAVIKNTPGTRSKHLLYNESQRDTMDPCDHLHTWPCFYNIIISIMLCLWIDHKYQSKHQIQLSLIMYALTHQYLDINSLVYQPF